MATGDPVTGREPRDGRIAWVDPRDQHFTLEKFTVEPFIHRKAIQDLGTLPLYVCM